MLKQLTILFLLAITFNVFAQDNDEDDFDINEYLEKLELGGPGKEEPLISYIEDDYDGLKQQAIFNASVREDENHYVNKNGFYYYIPNGYYSEYDDKTGKYDIEVRYNPTSADNLKRATFSAALSPPDINFREKELIKSILKKEGLKKLYPITMSRKLDVEFSDLAQHGVEASDISINAPDKLDSEITLSFSTDNVNELLTLLFGGNGLNGSVILYPNIKAGESSIRIPFKFKIKDINTYGKFELKQSDWRNDGWDNKTDYPIILETFHVLREDSPNTYKVYTWKMGRKKIPPKGSVVFNNVPNSIDNDNKVKKVWMEYSVSNCSSCDEVVKKKIIVGNSLPEVKIEYDILTPLSFTGAEYIKIKARSFQADPSGGNRAYLPSIRIESDSETIEGGTLYVPEGKSPNFEYEIQVIMEDGTRYKSDWIKSDEADVIIGKKQIETYISEFR